MGQRSLSGFIGKQVRGTPHITPTFRELVLTLEICKLGAVSGYWGKFSKFLSKPKYAKF